MYRIKILSFLLLFYILFPNWFITTDLHWIDKFKKDELRLNRTQHDFIFQRVDEVKNINFDTTTKTEDYFTYAPYVQKLETYYFEGGDDADVYREEEDNDICEDANSPIRDEEEYHGIHDDQKDWFGFLIWDVGKIHVYMISDIKKNYDVQIQLFYDCEIEDAERIKQFNSVKGVIDDEVEVDKIGKYSLFIGIDKSNFDLSSEYVLNVDYHILPPYDDP